MILPQSILEVISISLILLGFVFGWNNSGLTTGNLSNLLNYRLAVTVTVVGILAGFALDGWKMHTSISGLLSLQTIDPALSLAGVVTSLVLLFVFTQIKVPVSLSNVVVGAFAGASLLLGNLLNSNLLALIVSSWVLAPFFCALVSIVVYEILTKVFASLPLPTISWLSRVLLILGVFSVSFALGANNLGLIFFLLPKGIASLSIIETLLLFATVVGVVLFGKSIATVVGERIVMLSQMKTLSAIFGAALVILIFTQISVPLSLTQVVIGGMTGAGMIRRPSALNRREVTKLVASWTLVTILSVVVGFLSEAMISRFR